MNNEMPDTYSILRIKKIWNNIVVQRSKIDGNKGKRHIHICHFKSLIFDKETLFRSVVIWIFVIIANLQVTISIIDSLRLNECHIEE